MQKDKNYKLNLLISILGLITSQQSLAQHVLPVFSGYWYTDANLAYYDACETGVYSYKNKFPVSDYELAKQVLSDVPVYPDCKWGDIYLNHKYSSNPPDFLGNTMDWAKIVRNPSSQTGSSWGRDCKNDKGLISHSAYTNTFPSYTCPTGSRPSFRDYTDQTSGCSTEPDVCTADVVGRDLGSFPIKGAGHVGLTVPQALVLEVLKDPVEGIFTNSIDSFKHQPSNPYWGEKFDLSLAKIDEHTADGIWVTGINQNIFPFEYTFTWDWHPGGSYLHSVYDKASQQWINILTATSAKFRCDSFVYYAYLAGANLHIVPDFVPPVVPKTLFDSFLSFRDPSGYILNLDLAKYQNNLSKQKFEKLLENEFIDLPILDTSSYSYIKDPYISRLEKIDTLWGLAKKYQNSNVKFTYILDCLSVLKPIQIAQELINNYYSQTNIANKRKLLFTISNLLNDSSKTTQLIVMKDHLKEAISIQNFFKEVLNTANEKEVLRAAIQIYPSLVPSSQAESDIQAVLNRSEVRALEPLFSEAENITNQLWLAFASKEQQKIKIFSLLEKEKNRSDGQLFAQKLCSLLEQMPPDAINEEVRQPLSNYFLTNQGSLIEESPVEIQKSNLNSCRWLNAYSTLMVHGDDSQKNNFVLTYIRHQTNDRLQAQLLSQLTFEQIMLLPKSDREYYQTKFQNYLKNNTLPQIDKTIYMKAVTVIHIADTRSKDLSL